MTAIGCCCAWAAVTSNPVNGAGTRTISGVASGVGLGADADGVGSGVWLGVATATAEGPGVPSEPAGEGRSATVTKRAIASPAMMNPAVRLRGDDPRGGHQVLRKLPPRARWTFAVARRRIASSRLDRQHRSERRPT